jgi:hypothetical protein
MLAPNVGYLLSADDSGAIDTTDFSGIAMSVDFTFRYLLG